MTHEEWVKWTDQIENSLVRAETSGKDKDIIVLLRLAWQIGREHVKESEWQRQDTQKKT